MAAVTKCASIDAKNFSQLVNACDLSQACIITLDYGTIASPELETKRYYAN